MRKIVLSTVTILTLLFISCDKNKDEPQEPEVEVELNNKINDFVWRGMNTHYYWQQEIADLADTKNDDTNEYYTYLNGYSNPKDLFESLIFDKGNTDRNSVFIEDYRASDASRRGVNDTYGFEFGLSYVSEGSDKVIGYVKYVVPNSPADEAGVKRGDVFNSVNGTEMTDSNYSLFIDAYYNQTTMSLGFAKFENGEFVSNGVDVDLTITEIVENPVYYSSVINHGGTKVGYLVYNSFKYTFHKELNDVFGTFKSEGIQELVLDLRYNGGGTGLTSAYLCSMIYGNASENEVLAKVIHNSKNSDDNYYYPFFDTGRIYNIDGEYNGEDVSLNRLTSLNKLYVIVSGDTASASELLINGLRPYFGDSNVILIGTTTYGKNVGSFTIYDSPDFGPDNINPDHYNAIQPISLKIFNKLDQSDYTNGFDPDIEETEYILEMQPFGDVNEPLLKLALDDISGVGAKTNNLKRLQIGLKGISSSFDKKPVSRELYFLPDELK
ncbi:peptidase S41 [Aureibaculum marinum]|uniref:Peptidase S41 n=1 Tax=Aureibaculum marinum TaxID=2487930 RepID=A0A3N4NTH7_9FLAO|nr:S41 family peptidase [Aureibaculum marinum]RPD97987.1 peptidase S41 [Aureibaculum marinum]